ncbi:SPOR domain-containing protein [Lampropedia aestuarii]|nr:SPOR domain-containing protein [Lampropedia aestuarii]MDH5858338.1 SPOR domain-containing protein [Lampropedia aestuarii]
MALFESRKAEKATEEKTKRSRPARRVLDSVEDMRRRARHRLIGACLLVLTAIVVFPLLFDTEPRPLPVNAKVSVAGRDDTAPSLNVPTQVAMNGHGLSDGEEVVDTNATPSAAVSSAATAGAASNPATPAPSTSPAAPSKPLTVQTANAGREPVAAAKPAPEATSLAAQRAQEARAQSQRAQAEAAKPAAPASTGNATATATTAPGAAKPAEARPAVTVAAAVPPPPAVRPPASAATNSSAEAARARALLEGRPVETTPAPTASRSDEGRFIVQVGAFSDEAKVREIKQKLESVGLKTYTQVVQTSAGRATRVRVGPFANRADADRAAERVKGANLPAAIMSM